jgi:hypothetical protein
MCFYLVHGPFYNSLAPGQVEAGMNRVVVTLNASSKALHLFDITVACLLHPGIKSIRLPQTKHLKKCLHQLMYLPGILRVLQEMSQINALFRL